MAQDVHVDEGRLPLGVGGSFVHRAVVVLAQVAEVATYLVGDFQPFQKLVVGEQPAVVAGDVQPGVPFVDRLEKSLEVLPDGTGTVSPRSTV